MGYTISDDNKRTRGVRYFLTIPKYEMGSEASSETRANGEGPVSVKERLRDLLKEREEYLSQYMIGEESHIDGSKHYHIYLKYIKTREFGFNHFDYLGKHGKLEVCRSPLRSYMYISKEDKEPLSNFDYEAGILRGTTEEIAKYMSQTGKKYSDLLVSEGRTALVTKWRTLKSFEKEYEAERKLIDLMKKKKGIKLIDKELIEANLTKEEKEIIEKDSGLQKIIEHINNVVKYKWERPFKTKNLLLYSSKPNTGKTSLIRKLGEHCPIFHFPRGEWFHGYKNQTFWGMLWNEVNIKGWDIENLKNMLEGTAVTLEVKGGHIDKDDNPEVFMTSNYTLKEMVEERYKYDEMRCERTLKTLEARIEEVNLDEFVNNHGDIFFLQKLIVSK
jgi:hypothetical protein